MSFGISTSDFIELIKFVNQVRRRFVDAPKQLAPVHDKSDQESSLSNILRDIDDLAETHVLTAEQKERMSSCTQTCENLFGDFNSLLDEYQCIEDKPPGSPARTRRIWKKLKFRQSELQELQTRLASVRIDFNLILEKLMNNDIAKIQFALDRIMDNKSDDKRQVILEWLSNAEYAGNHAEILKVRQPDTGQWILNTSQYKSWLASTGSIMLCSGIPGAGKTMLTATVIEDLQQSCSKTTNFGLSYIYCSYKKFENQDLHYFIASILRQLSSRLLPLPDAVVEMYKRHKEEPVEATTSELIKVLTAVIESFTKVFIIVDALDEWSTIRSVRSSLLESLVKLNANNGIYIFLTYRSLAMVVDHALFPRQLKLEIQPDRHDVQKYLKGRFTDFPTCVRMNESLQKEIGLIILDKIGGMFLLAKLFMDGLQSKRSITAVRKALATIERLPKCSDSLRFAYEDNIRRLEGQTPDDLDLARKIMAWVYYARRPLTMRELQYALAVEEDCVFDLENMVEPEDILNVCMGLVTVDEQSKLVGFFHATTQEFFEELGRKWLNLNERYIAKVCVSYLINNAFEFTLCSTTSEFNDTVQNYPLFDFSSQFWGYYVRQTNCSELLKLSMRLLKHPGKSSDCMRGLVCNTQPSSECPLVGIDKSNGLHLAAYFGLESEISSLLELGFSPDLTNIAGQTPLTIASMEGHPSIVQLLLNRSSRSINNQDFWGRTPLSWAAFHGHKAVVKVLLEQKATDVNLRDYNDQPPLLHAIAHGNESVVELLLIREDIRLDTEDKLNHTALSSALSISHKQRHHSISGQVSPDGDGDRLINETVKLMQLVEHPRKRKPFDSKYCSNCGDGPHILSKNCPQCGGLLGDC